MSLEAHVITDNLDELLAVLPAYLSDAIGIDKRTRLVEIVLDLGRKPEARFTSGYEYLSDAPVTREELDGIETKLGQFGDDNRAGLPATLHRISAMRNRRGAVVGLTLRVGRAVTGIVDILRDIIESGQSVLLMGRPGLGKTTLLREMARVLADEVGKRVVIVDTSNEIAGDGDVPHPAIGRARRMQVARVAQQHDVMIEAVENHMPEVVVIDEIGRSEEALAARTIAERGVQLVATVHGNTLDNLLANPTLSDLIGGIGAVTLSDEEARRRGTQKTVLERKAPPTFGVVVEMIERDRIAVRTPVADVVDLMLRGYDAPPELRWRDEQGEIQRAKPAAAPRSDARPERESRDERGRPSRGKSGKPDRYAKGYGRRDYDRDAPKDARDTTRERDNTREAGRTRDFGTSFGEGSGAAWSGSVRNGGTSGDDEPGPATISAKDAATPPDTSRASSPTSPIVAGGAGHTSRWSEFFERANVDGETLTGERVAEEAARALEDDAEPDWDEPTLENDETDNTVLLSDASFDPMKARRLYPFGVSRSRLTRAIKQLGLPLTVARTWQDADAVLMLSGAGLSSNMSLLREAREMRLPILGVRGNTYAEILGRLNDLYSAAYNNLESDVSPKDAAIQEAREAVQRVLSDAQAIELRPQGRTLRRVQHQVAERYHLRSYSVGREPQRRVRFMPANGRRA